MPEVAHFVLQLIFPPLSLLPFLHKELMPYIWSRLSGWAGCTWVSGSSLQERDRESAVSSVAMVT